MLKLPARETGQAAAIHTDLAFTDPRLVFLDGNDRAGVVTVSILQIVETMPADQWRQAIEDYLRNEFADVARTALPEIRPEDE